MRIILNLLQYCILLSERSSEYWYYGLNRHCGLFPDPASVYAYQLFSVHHDIIWYLILILIFVYWSLYKIIRDSNVKVFNKQSGIILYFFEIHSLKVIIVYVYLIIQKILLTILDLYLDCREIYHFFKLGGEVMDFWFYIIKWYLDKIQFLVGLRAFRFFIRIKPRDLEGKILLADEHIFFDPASLLLVLYIYL